MPLPDQIHLDDTAAVARLIRGQSVDPGNVRDDETQSYRWHPSNAVAAEHGPTRVGHRGHFHREVPHPMAKRPKTCEAFEKARMPMAETDR
jgi:hypothetical protein